MDLQRELINSKFGQFKSWWLSFVSEEDCVLCDNIWILWDRWGYWTSIVVISAEDALWRRSQAAMSLWSRSSSKLVEAVWMSHHGKFTLTVSLYRFSGRFFFLLPAPSSPYSSWRGMRWSSNLMHVPPIAARPWWVWAQYWYNLHGPGPLVCDTVLTADAK